MSLLTLRRVRKPLLESASEGKLESELILCPQSTVSHLHNYCLQWNITSTTPKSRRAVSARRITPRSCETEALLVRDFVQLPKEVSRSSGRGLHSPRSRVVPRLAWERLPGQQTRLSAPLRTWTINVDCLEGGFTIGANGITRDPIGIQYANCTTRKKRLS